MSLFGHKKSKTDLADLRYYMQRASPYTYMDPPYPRPVPAEVIEAQGEVGPCPSCGDDHSAEAVAAERCSWLVVCDDGVGYWAPAKVVSWWSSYDMTYDYDN